MMGPVAFKWEGHFDSLQVRRVSNSMLLYMNRLSNHIYSQNDTTTHNNVVFRMWKVWNGYGSVQALREIAVPYMILQPKQPIWHLLVEYEIYNKYV